MSLPKIVRPKFTATLPSSGEVVTYRPFLVKEEKALLMAGESGDTDSICRAIKDSIEACVDDLDVNSLPFFDVEYLFLHLRAKSVGENVKLTYRHRNGVNRLGEPCAHETEIVIPLDKIEVKFDPENEKEFMINSEYGVVMQYPTLDQIQKYSTPETLDKLMASCIKAVWTRDDVFPSESVEDGLQFISSLSSVEFDKLSQFFETMPRLEHTVTYQCAGCGQEDTVKFEGVADFF